MIPVWTPCKIPEFLWCLTVTRPTQSTLWSTNTMVKSTLECSWSTDALLITLWLHSLVLVGTQLHADGNELCRVIRICKDVIQGCFIVFIIVVPAVGAVHSFVVQNKHIVTGQMFSNSRGRKWVLARRQHKYKKTEYSYRMGHPVWNSFFKCSSLDGWHQHIQQLVLNRSGHLQYTEHNYV